MPQQPKGTSSKLVARLRGISRGSPAPFGFVGQAQSRGTAAMLLIASLHQNDATLVTAAVEAGADAVLGHLHIGEAPQAPKPQDETAPPAGSSPEAPTSESPAAHQPKPEPPVAQAGGPSGVVSEESSQVGAATESPGADAEGSDSEAAGPAEERSDVYFGGVAEERQRLAEMVRAAEGHPFGIVVGANGDLTVAELEELIKMGVDFVAVYPHRAPAAILSMEALGHVARLDPGYPSGATRGLAELEVDAFALSAGRPRDSLGSFTVHDMANFRQFLDTLHRPVMVASSWDILPDDLKFFREQGVEALILTPHVLGETAASVGEKVAEFRKAIAKLGPPIGRGRSQEGRRVILPNVQPAGDQVEHDDDDDDGDDDE